MTVLEADHTAAASISASARVSFDTDPSKYKHWKLDFDGPVATLTLAVDPQGGLVPGYELKMNSYDLGVDIELYDAVQRLRFEHPEIRSVVVTGGLERIFCAGANIRMLAQSTHSWKVNFCKFTNETRNGIEDATANSGQTYIAAVNGTAAGGGYELAAACDQIVLVDDGSTAVSLPEVPLLGVLPGTGGLTRVVDKRKVRKDRADVFATKSEGIRGETAVEWGLVDETVKATVFREAVRARAERAAATSVRPADGRGVELTPLQRVETEDRIAYSTVAAELLRSERRVEIVVMVPDVAPSAGLDRILAQGVEYWPLRLTRELDDLILGLRINEPDLGTWVFRVQGPTEVAIAYDRQLREFDDNWLVNEINLYFKRTLKRLDVTSRSLVAVIEPGSAYAGLLAELAFASDRQYMLEGIYEDVKPTAEPAAITLTASNFGPYPMGNGLTRLESRFWGDDASLGRVRQELDGPIQASDADRLGLVTFALDDIDFADELRIALEERAALSPDALTGMEASHRFVGPETIETKIFGRLTAWQNWIFVRPNASGPQGALRRYGTGARADYDRNRV